VEGAASKAFVESAALNNYVTQQGDTLRSIADRLGVSSQELAKANGLRANARLTPGQELKLPSK
jgi:LysM repeat protein